MGGYSAANKLLWGSPLLCPFHQICFEYLITLKPLKKRKRGVGRLLQESNIGWFYNSFVAACWNGAIRCICIITSWLISTCASIAVSDSSLHLPEGHKTSYGLGWTAGQPLPSRESHISFASLNPAVGPGSSPSIFRGLLKIDNVLTGEAETISAQRRTPGLGCATYRMWTKMSQPEVGRENGDVMTETGFA